MLPGSLIDLHLEAEPKRERRVSVLFCFVLFCFE